MTSHPVRDAKTLFTRSDVAAMARVSLSTIIRHEAEGLLKAVRIGRMVRFTKDAVELYLRGK